MAFQQKPGGFALFRNIRKKEGSNEPDYKGDGLDVNGTPVEIAAWIKDGAKGKFMACQMKPKTDPPRRDPSRMPPPRDDDSDIPF
jgi:hypothetical protein